MGSRPVASFIQLFRSLIWVHQAPPVLPPRTPRAIQRLHRPSHPVPEPPNHSEPQPQPVQTSHPCADSVTLARVGLATQSPNARRLTPAPTAQTPPAPAPVRAGPAPVLLRPPPTASPFSPLALPLPPFVPRLPPCALGRPPFAVGRSPFVVSPSASSGQALSNHERPLHRPAYPNLLALPPSYWRPPVFRLWAPTRPNRGPAASAPRQPAPQKSAKSRARRPGSPTGGPGPAGASTPKPAPPPPPPTPPMPVEALPRTRSGARTQSCPGLHPPRPTRHPGVRGEPAPSLPKEPTLSPPKGNPVVIPRPKTSQKCTPRRLKSFLEKTLTRARPPQNRPAAPHRPQPPFVRFPGPNLESAIT